MNWYIQRVVSKVTLDPGKLKSTLNIISSKFYTMLPSHFELQCKKMVNSLDIWRGLSDKKKTDIIHTLKTVLEYYLRRSWAKSCFIIENCSLNVSPFKSTICGLNHTPRMHFIYNAHVSCILSSLYSKEIHSFYVKI